MSHQADQPTSTAPAPGMVERPGVLDIVRLLVELAAFASLAIWGFAAFPLPWNIVAGILTPLLAIVVWALFLSPRAVMRLHPFAAAFVELMIYVAVTAAWWSLDQPWIGLAFAVVAVTVGVLAGRRRFA